MKRSILVPFWTCALLVLVVLICRLLWHAAMTETGMEMLRLQWRDSTWGWIVGKRTPIQSHEPAEQARLWLNEVDRILRRVDNDDELTMGAALVLDSPSLDYEGRYLRRIETIYGLGTMTELDREGLESAENAFELQCREKCLELASMATSLDPSNVEWWRLRALLLWRYSRHSKHDGPRTTDWLEVLKEASLHDADNALYDYLAAYFYWESSADVDISGTDERLLVHDVERFKQGVKHFKNAQTKQYFAVGDSGLLTVADFLRHTKTPLPDHIKIAQSRAVYPRRILLFRNVWRWQNWRASEFAAGGDAHNAVTAHRENVRLIEQFTSAGIATAHNELAVSCLVDSAAGMNTLANKNAGLFHVSELEEIKTLEENARLTKKVLKHVGQELSKSRSQQPGGVMMTGNANIYFLVELLPSLIVFLVLCGTLAIKASTTELGIHAPRIGPVEYAIAFGVALIGSVVIFGLAPAKIIPPSLQAWTATMLLFAIAGLAILTAWIRLRRQAFRFSLRDLLTCMFVLGVLLGMLAITSRNGEAFAKLPFDLSMPPRGWEGVNAMVLEEFLRPQAPWLWAVLQWLAYHGAYWTLGIWLAIVAVLLRYKQRSLYKGEDAQSFASRIFIGIWIRSLGKPFFVLAVLIAIIYASFAPKVVAEVEREFQDVMSFARHPSNHWSKVERALQQVRSNQQVMEQFSTEVKTEMTKE